MCMELCWLRPSRPATYENVKAHHVWCANVKHLIDVLDQLKDNALQAEVKHHWLPVRIFEL